MKVRYIGHYADDGVELHDGTWFDGNADTEVDEELARVLLEQPSNWQPADAEARALVSAEAPAEQAPAVPEPAPVAEPEPVPDPEVLT